MGVGIIYFCGVTVVLWFSLCWWVWGLSCSCRGGVGICVFWGRCEVGW